MILPPPRDRPASKVSDKSLVSTNGDALRTLASKHIYHASQEFDANGETGREQVGSVMCAAVQEAIDARSSTGKTRGGRHARR